MKIHLLGLARGSPPDEHEHGDSYVVSYDPEYHLPDGSYDGGWLETTTNPKEATEFSFPRAVVLWMSGPTCQCHHLRPDGEPNRPLMAFNVEFA